MCEPACMGEPDCMGETSSVRVLITGGSGFLARALALSAAARGHDVVARPRTELDVTDPVSLRAAMRGIDVVVNTAYVPLVASDPDAIGLAPSVNVTGAANVAHAATGAGVRLVHVSSDVVFAGDGRPRTERDEPDPIPRFAYGQQKAEAEHLVRAAAPAATIARTSLLWDGHGGSSLEAMIRTSVRPGSGVRHFVDEFRCPVQVHDVAAGIMAAVEDDEPPPVLHLGGPDRLDRFSIAVALAPGAGVDPAALRSGRSSDHPGERPRDLVLDSTLARHRYGWAPRSLVAASR